MDVLDPFFDVPPATLSARQHVDGRFSRRILQSHELPGGGGTDCRIFVRWLLFSNAFEIYLLFGAISRALLLTDYLKRSEGVTIPCRTNSDGAIKMESELTSESITWTDSAGRDLDEGHFKVDAEKRLVLNNVQQSDAGSYVCTVNKVTSGDVVTVVRHVVQLNGTASL